MKYLFWLLANVLWFGVFVYAVFFKGWSGAFLLIPLFIHWGIDEIR